MTGWPALALALAVSGCASETDIVATSLPGSDDKAPNPSQGTSIDAGAKSEPVDCTEAARDLILLDKAGGVLRVQADTLDVTQLATPKCLRSSVVAAALDHAGRLWAVTTDRRAWWVDLDTGACTETKLGAAVDALAFVSTPSDASEQLYVVDADEVYVVDPHTLDRRPLGTLGTLQTKLLSGTAAGELLAIVGDGDPTILSIRLEDAQATNKWQVKVPAGSFFAAGAAWGEDLTLVFAGDLYGYQRETGEQTFLTSLPVTQGSVVCAASSVCATREK